MNAGRTTLNDTDHDAQRADAPVPGVVITYAAGRPASVALRARGPLVVGRDTHEAFAGDDRISRQHASIEWLAGAWRVRDLDSRNGTYVEGEQIKEFVLPRAPRVIRVGQALLTAMDDIRPVEHFGVRCEGVRIVGPSMRQALDRVAAFAATGDNLLIHGESGTGKELVAEHFHRASPRAGGPFIAVNCATIPTSVAERLLFGSRKGAFSGAVDAPGYIRSADGGVLFLDELGEMELALQAKLLRVLERGEVTPLGATSGHPVRVQFVFATHRDLREAVAAERFRADLYHRISVPAVQLAPLSLRIEEIPWLASTALDGELARLELSPKLLESLMLRAWPGNVRELRRHVRSAAIAAKAEGATEIALRHVDETAGRELSTKPASVAPPPAGDAAPLLAGTIIEALRVANGNVSAAARALGLHRTQLRRYIAQFQIQLSEDGK